jgi:molecular chaperone GrpE
MVQRQFIGVIARHGCVPFESVGTPFDPQRHEAVQQVESAAHAPNTVIDEYHKGYLLEERLIRPAMVVVSTKPKDAPPPSEDDDAADSGPIAVDISGEAHMVGPHARDDDDE